MCLFILDDPSNSDDDGLKIDPGVMYGSIGAAVGIVFLAIICLVYRKRRPSREKRDGEESMPLRRILRGETLKK